MSFWLFVCWEHEWKEYSFFILLTTFTRVLDIFQHREKKVYFPEQQTHSKLLLNNFDQETRPLIVNST